MRCSLKMGLGLAQLSLEVDSATEEDAVAVFATYRAGQSLYELVRHGNSWNGFDLVNAKTPTVALPLVEQGRRVVVATDSLGQLGRSHRAVERVGQVAELAWVTTPSVPALGPHFEVDIAIMRRLDLETGASRVP